ncbi:MAG: NUDIX domain-containing protein [Pseudomonadota bacterium]
MVTATDSQELLDIVDESDRVIGVDTRHTIHARGLLHRATHILVFNSAGELFIQKRSMDKDSEPGLWDSSAAGHVKSGEDYYACASRELDEELGLAIESPLEMLFLLPPEKSFRLEHCMVFRYYSDGPFDLQTEEVSDGKWIGADELDRRVCASDPSLTSTLRSIWQRIRTDGVAHSH